MKGKKESNAVLARAEFKNLNIAVSKLLIVSSIYKIYLFKIVIYTKIS